MSSEKPTSWADVIRKAIAAALVEVHTSIPGRVVKWDASTQKADIQPLVKLTYLDEADKRVAESLPVVTAVPVIFPGAGGYRTTFPIKAGKDGTVGLLTFCEISLDEWLNSGDEITPADNRRFNLSDGVFIPGLRDFSHPLSSIPDDRMTIGSDSGPQSHYTDSAINHGSNSPGELEPAALGQTLSNYLTQLTTYLGGLTLPVSGSTAGPPMTPPPTPPNIKSSVVNLKK